MTFPPRTLAIYRISRPKCGGTIEHDAILRETEHGWALIEMHPDHGLQVRDWRSGPSDEGFDLDSGVACANLSEADARLDRVLRMCPLYALFGFNCQHFASFIMTGNARSRAVDGFVGAGTVVAAGLFVGFVARPIVKRLFA